MTEPTLVLAGGGTGGHVYPLLAVAEALRARAPGVRLVFVGTARGIETRVVPASGYELVLVNVVPIRGGGLMGAARGALRASAAIPEAWTLLRRIEPRAILSIGGYAAGPLTLAARLRGVPIALVEPNARIGLANRLIAPLVERAYTAFSEVERHFPRGSVLRAGVPIRDGFSPSPLRCDPGRLRVLVLGGSQGAEYLNQALPRALSRIASSRIASSRIASSRIASSRIASSRIEGRVEIVHQAGKERDGAVRERYRSLGLAEHAEVFAYIDDMPAALGAADLVVGRAGASAVAELCAVGRPSLLVPYPYAAADHQHHNARALEQQGASVCLAERDATPERLAQEIEGLVTTPSRLEKMAERALEIGHPDARWTIARDFLGLAGLATAARRESGAPGSPEAASGPRSGFLLEGVH